MDVKGVNKSGGNMYPDTHTVNFYGGQCGMCEYCYAATGRIKSMKKYQGRIRLHEPAFSPLKSNMTVFVNSCTDLCHPQATDDMIKAVLRHLRRYPDIQYLIQTKNPERLLGVREFMPSNFVVGTTIESDQATTKWNITCEQRVRAMVEWSLSWRCHTMISVEPIMRFNLDTMIDWLYNIKPDYVSVGANSRKDIQLPEPSADEIMALVAGLEKFTEVRLKANLERILGREMLDALRAECS